MALIIGVVSQKGGVGKSTIARLIAREYATNDFQVLIADMDTSQSTCVQWNKRRLVDNIQPSVNVQLFGSVNQVTRLVSNYDLIVFDGAPHATAQTSEIARQADLVIIPSGTALDDLEPARELGKELIKAGIPLARIAMLLNHVGSSQIEVDEAMEFLADKDFYVLPAVLHEKISYRRASDEGKAATETTHPSTNKKADEVAQTIMNRLEEVEKINA